MQEEANGAAAVVFRRGDGDVEVSWAADGLPPVTRRFRAHLGHVVEVMRDGRTQTVGAGLVRSGHCLRASAADLVAVVQQELATAPPPAGGGGQRAGHAEGRGEDEARTASVEARTAEAERTGLLRRVVGLLQAMRDRTGRSAE